MADKDMRVVVTPMIGGEPIELATITGEAVDSTQVAGSQTYANYGATTGSGTPLTTRTTHHWTTDTIFLRYGDREKAFKITDNAVPVRPGHRVTVIFGSRPKDKTMCVLGLYNHDTRAGKMIGHLDPPRKRWIKTAIWIGVFVVMYFIFGSFVQCDSYDVHKQCEATSKNVGKLWGYILSSGFIGMIAYFTYVNRLNRRFHGAIKDRVEKAMGYAASGKAKTDVEAALAG